jgi:hypothetical protein
MARSHADDEQNGSQSRGPRSSRTLRSARRRQKPSPGATPCSPALIRKHAALRAQTTQAAVGFWKPGQVQHLPGRRTDEGPRTATLFLAFSDCRRTPSCTPGPALRRPPVAGAPPAPEVTRPSRHCRAVRPTLFSGDKFEAWTRRTGNDLHHGQAPFVLKPNRDKQHIFGIASRGLPDRRLSPSLGDPARVSLSRSLSILAWYACDRRQPQSASPAPRTWCSPRIDPIGSKGACSPRPVRTSARQRFCPDRASAGSANGQKELALPR